MDVKSGAERFDQAIAPLPIALRNALLGIPQSVKAATFEVRLRVGRPVCLTSGNRCWFIDRQSQLHNISRHCFLVTQREISETFISMCEYSVQSHEQELVQGFLSLKGGHRAGICGTAVSSEGKVTAIRDISSINLRIAREIQGVATPLIEQIFKKDLCGTLIIGVPASGKTTILRDLTRQLANGEAGRPLKVAVVDERGELGAVYDGVPQNNLGATSDILNGYPKGAGILMAVRTLSPHIVICDEIGARDEVDSILDGLNCGVKVVATAHAASVDELLSRRQIARLLQHGAFDRIVRLGDADTPGHIEEIVKVGELKHEAVGHDTGRSMLLHDGDVHGIRIIRTGGEN